MKEKKTTLFRFLATMLMVSAFLPLVFNNLPPVIRSHHIWAILWVIALLFLQPGIFTSSIFQILTLNALVIFCIANQWIWVNVVEDAKRMIYYEYYEISIGLLVFTYFRESRDFYGLSKVCKLAFYCIVVTMIMSIIVSFINPMFARDIVGIDEAGLDERTEILSFKAFGGGSYGFASGIVALIPILIYFYKNPGESIWKKSFILFSLVLICFCLIRVQIFGNILVAALVLIFSIVGTRNFKKSMIFIAAVTAILLIIPVDYYISLLEKLGDYMPANSHIKSKFEDMAQFFRLGAEIGVNTEAGIRAQRFPLLWEAFLSDPFIGGKVYNHHLFWMNKLAVFGIIGTIPFLMLFINHFRTANKLFSEKFRFYFLISVLSIVGLGTIKALFGRELWYVLFTIAPGMYYLKLQKNLPVPAPEKKANENTAYQ